MVEDGTLILETDDLAKRIGRRWVVKGIDLQITRGDIFGFLGPNGAGKSTTIRMIMGLISPTRGTIKIEGKSYEGYSNVQLRQRVSALIEMPSFYEYLSARNNLKIISRLTGIEESGIVDRSLELVGLGSRADDKVGSYSQGMKQRLGIAQAVMGNPELVILDEPTNGLDPEGINEVRELVFRLNREVGITFLICSHILKEIEGLCNRVAILLDGRLQAQGSLQELLDRDNRIITIQVSALPRAEKLLASLPGVDEVCVSRPKDGCLQVSSDSLQAAEINAFLVEQGIMVSRLHHPEGSLESYYLQVIGHSRQRGED